MPKPNVIVGVVGQVLPPPALTSRQEPSPLPRPGVVLTGNRVAFFDLAHPRLASQVRVLESLERTGWPAHIEIQADGTIIEVRIPAIGRVVRVSKRAAGPYEAMLDSCEARFVIDPLTHSDDLQYLERCLREGLFAVIAGDGDRIFDVQELPGEIVLPIPAMEPVRCGEEVIECTSILEAEADIERIFHELDAEKCSLPEAPSGCIPFLYARQGCWVRAHRMCQILAQQNPPIVAGKMWLFGALTFCTENVPECVVTWGWHVAPFVRLRTGSTPEIRVLDPSMFTHSVTRDEWVRAQNAPGASLRYADAWVCMLTDRCFGRAEVMFPKGPETEVYLEAYRVDLTRMTPPPPYPHCVVFDCAKALRTSAES